VVDRLLANRASSAAPSPPEVVAEQPPVAAAAPAPQATPPAAPAAEPAKSADAAEFEIMERLDELLGNTGSNGS